MKPIFPNPKMPLNQKCLLLCFFQKIIKEDIKNSQSQNDAEWKELWFGKWENQVRHFLEKKKNSIVNLQVMKDPDNKTIDIWDNLDIQLLYNNIRNEKSNLRKSWEIELYGQCDKFTPFDWDDLLQKEKRREKGWHKKLYDNWIKPLCPNLQLDITNKKKTLGWIATYLNVVIP